jgi:hypothetical protein
MNQHIFKEFSITTDPETSAGENGPIVHVSIALCQKDTGKQRKFVVPSAASQPVDYAHHIENAVLQTFPESASAKSIRAERNLIGSSFNALYSLTARIMENHPMVFVKIEPHDETDIVDRLWLNVITVLAIYPGRDGESWYVGHDLAYKHDGQYCQSTVWSKTGTEDEVLEHVDVFLRHTESAALSQPIKTKLYAKNT